jgi:hypothetical protein
VQIGAAGELVEVRLGRTRQSAAKVRYGPSAELSGAITQALYQQSALHSNWLFHQTQLELWDLRPDATKCVVIAGMTPMEEAQRRSFEIFRNACKNVEVVTFDELLGKLKILLHNLAPPERGD